MVHVTYFRFLCLFKKWLKLSLFAHGFLQRNLEKDSLGKFM